MEDNYGLVGFDKMRDRYGADAGVVFSFDEYQVER